MLKPDGPFDIRLSSGRESRAYGLVLDEGAGALSIGAISQDDSVYVRNVGKRTGDFDEQRSWKGGRGVEKFNDNNEGFWDSENAWTLSKGHVHNGLLWRFARGLRKATTNFSNSKSWRPLYGASLGISVEFTLIAGESGTYTNMQFWVRWRGSSSATNTLTARIHSSDGTPLETDTMTVEDATDGDSVSRLLTFSISQSLTGGTDYILTLYGASSSNENEHWEVAVDASDSDSKISADPANDNPTTWDTPLSTFSMLFRITDADVARTFKPFYLDNHLYLVDIKDDGSTSQLYINGDRGKATAGTSTTLTDTNNGVRSTDWTTNMWAGAWVRIVRGAGKGQARQIASNTGTVLTVSTAWKVNPTTTSEYVIYFTDIFQELTSTGLGAVKGEPAVLGNIAYFPQGSAAAIRNMALDYTAATNHKYRAEAGSITTADFLIAHQDKNDGPVVWRAFNGSSGTIVHYAKAVAYGTDLTFNTQIPAGDYSFLITGLNKEPGILYVLKEDGLGTVAGGTYTTLKSSATPDPENGLASLKLDKFFLYSWLHSVIRVFGSSHDDIGQDYRSFGLPDGREGNFASMDAYISLPLFAVDADSGTSSVLAFDDIGWHEILRGYAAGKRIRMVKVQNNLGAQTRLWTDVGGELVYQDFPLKKAAPRLYSGSLYQHEGVVESSIIDMGTASDLPKFIKQLVVTVANLNAEGMEIFLDYQTDAQCHTNEWTYAGLLAQSPESINFLGLQNIKRFAYRLRMNTDDATQSPDVEGVVPNGYARTPLKQVFTMRIKSGGIYQIGSQSAADTSKLWRYLMENARLPYSIKMESKYLEADGYNVIVHPPRMFPYKPPRPGEAAEASLTLTLEEI